MFSALLRVTRHLSNGAKHFDKLRPSNRSVRETVKHGGWWAQGYYRAGFWVQRTGRSPS